ncbi:MAG: kinase-like domain-containing protein, partial [Olpidium bornovanus]
MLCLEQQKLNGHQKIVRYYDSQVSQLREAFEILILMEFCHGRGLTGPLPPPYSVVPCVTSICAPRRRSGHRSDEPPLAKSVDGDRNITHAVAYMHYMKPPVIHRDLKVENVLLDGSGGYKLCDFGSATTRIIPPLAPLAVKDIQQLEEEISRQTTLQYRSPEMVDVYQRRGMTEKIGRSTYRRSRYFGARLDDRIVYAGARSVLFCAYSPRGPQFRYLGGCHTSLWLSDNADFVS